MFYYADTSFVHQFLFLSPRECKIPSVERILGSYSWVEMQSSQCCYCYYNILCAMAHCVHMPNTYRTLWKFMHFATIIIQIFYSFQTEFRTNFCCCFHNLIANYNSTAHCTQYSTSLSQANTFCLGNFCRQPFILWSCWKKRNGKNNQK